MIVTFFSYVWEVSNKVVYIGGLGSSLYLQIGHVPVVSPVTNILRDAHVEQNRLLRHHPDLGTEPADIQILISDSIQGHGTGSGVIELLDQRKESGFTTATDSN